MGRKGGRKGSENSSKQLKRGIYNASLIFREDRAIKRNISTINSTRTETFIKRLVQTYKTKMFAVANILLLWLVSRRLRVQTNKEQFL